jgi:hypothetical protein
VPAITLDLSGILARDNLAASDPAPSPSGAALRGPGTLILHFNPSQFPYVRSFLPEEAFEGKYVVASCAWELERIPEDWVPWLALVDEVWVPSRFVAQAIANAGVRLPHRVIPPLLTGRPRRRRSASASDSPKTSSWSSPPSASAPAWGGKTRKPRWRPSAWPSRMLRPGLS